MYKKLPTFVALGLLASGAAPAQTATPLAFEVATVRPSAPLDTSAMKAGTAHIGTKIDASRVDIGTASLFRLICTAYRLRPYQVSGPEWLKATMFDIQAKIPAGASADQVPDMLKTLMEERFGLKVHHDSKEQPVYALVVAKGGPKLVESTPDPATATADAPKPDPKAGLMEMSVPTTQGDVKLSKSPQGISIEMPGGEIKGKIRALPVQASGSSPMRLHLMSSETTMKTFAEMLSVGVVDRPVVDMTGLTGSYDLAVDISEYDAMSVARASVSFLGVGGGEGGNGGGGATGVASEPSGSAIKASIQNLGLNLDPRKLPLDMLVVDHIEKAPTEN